MTYQYFFNDTATPDEDLDALEKEYSEAEPVVIDDDTYYNELYIELDDDTPVGFGDTPPALEALLQALPEAKVKWDGVWWVSNETQEMVVQANQDLIDNLKSTLKLQTIKVNKIDGAVAEGDDASAVDQAYVVDDSVDPPHEVTVESLRDYIALLRY